MLCLCVFDQRIYSHNYYFYVESVGDLTPSELKKLQRKQKKAQLKAQEEKKGNCHDK